MHTSVGVVSLGMYPSAGHYEAAGHCEAAGHYEMAGQCAECMELVAGELDCGLLDWYGCSRSPFVGIFQG